MAERIEISEAYKFWDVLREGNQLTEIRMIANDGKTASGIFDNVEDMISAIRPYSQDWNIYYTINGLPDDVSGLPQYKKIIQRPKQTCTDAMITHRDWVVCDLDSKRLSGTNATDEQVEYTKKKANEIYKFLVDNGFHKPIVVFSSNGVHLYLKCAMINNEANTMLVKRFLQSISMIFSDEHTDVDEKVFNSARIMRLPSSYSCKGNKTDAKRVQRLCKFVSIPQDIKINDIEYFRKIANLYPEEEIKPSKENNYSNEKFDLDGFIAKHNIEISKIENVSGGKKYILKRCAFNEQHNGKDAVIFQKDNGGLSYVCLHNSCSEKHWSDFRKLYEPDYQNKQYPNPRQFTPYGKKIKPIYKEQVENKEKGSVWQELDEIEDEDRSKIVTIPSGITQYDKECCGFDKPSLSVWSGSNGCVDCDTEFFNGSKWVKISEYKDGDKVLQYNEDGTAELVYPLLYHKYKCDNLTLIKNCINSVNQCLSDEHNLIYYTSKGNLFKKNFKDFKDANSVQCKFIPFFNGKGRGIDWEDKEIKLELAISAEGHLFEHRLNKKKRVRINLKHDYKKKELIALLDANNIDYEVKKYNPRDFGFDTFLFYWNKASKIFPSEWYNMSNKQFEVVKKNITIWDGNISKDRGGSYSTTKKENADFVQYCVSSLQYRCSILIDNRSFRKNCVYRLNFSKNHSKISVYKGGLEYQNYKTKDGYKYCFTVPSGMLVLRRNNAINVTGNSAKSTLLNQVMLNAINKGFKVAMYSGELRGKKIKRWLLYQAAGKTYNKKSQYNDYDYYTPDNIKSKIIEWTKGHLFNYNTKYSHNIEQVCKEIESICKTKDVDMVLVDNLSCLDIEDLDGSLNEQQKAAIKMMLRLANELEVALHIVIHPKKATTWLTKDDISGSKTITDLADCVFIVHRWNLATQKAATDYLPSSVYSDINSSGATNVVEVVKHREFGDAEGHIYKLYFETESKRLKNSIAEHIIYGWQDQPIQHPISFPQSEPIAPPPFEQVASFYPPTPDDMPFAPSGDEEMPF